MKAVLTKSLLSFALICSVAVVPAGATLIDRGSFNDGFGGSVNLIYDTDFDITWLGDANFGAGSAFDDGGSTIDGRMTWQNAVNWAASLTVGGFNNWRLPTTTLPDASCSINFGGHNCTGSEMGQLFYDELGGTAHFSILTSGAPRPSAL